MTAEPVPDGHLELPNGWHLVTVANQQVSIAPDGLIMFPRHIHPSDAKTFATALLRAQEVASQVVADNEARAAANTSRGLPTRRLIVTEGPPPPGTTRLPNSAIGRPKTTNRKQIRQ